jgi:hypothetical protein
MIVKRPIMLRSVTGSGTSWKVGPQPASSDPMEIILNYDGYRIKLDPVEYADTYARADMLHRMSEWIRRS